MVTMANTCCCSHLKKAVVAKLTTAKTTTITVACWISLVLILLQTLQNKQRMEPERAPRPGAASAANVAPATPATRTGRSHSHSHSHKPSLSREQHTAQQLLHQNKTHVGAAKKRVIRRIVTKTIQHNPNNISFN